MWAGHKTKVGMHNMSSLLLLCGLLKHRKYILQDTRAVAARLVCVYLEADHGEVGPPLVCMYLEADHGEGRPTASVRVP